MKIMMMLKEKRKEHQLTQEQLAEKILVSTKTISNWETGKTQPDIENLILLAKLFELSLDNLLLEGSEIVESINKDVKKGRNLKKIMVAITLPLVLIIIFISWKSYQGNTMSIVPLADISNIRLTTDTLTPETKITGQLKLSNRESFLFVDALHVDNTLYLMIYKEINLFQHQTHFDFDLKEHGIVVTNIDRIVLTYWNTKELDGFDSHQIKNEFPQTIIWER